MRNGLSSQIAASVILMIFTGDVLAQATVPSCGSVQPSQVGKAIQSQQPRQAAEVLPPLQEKREAAPRGLPPEAQKITFQLNAVKLTGNHVYSTEQLKFIYEKDLHHVITIARLFEIVQEITNYYRNNGYILSRAILPPQHVKGGVVTIQVIEGYVGHVEVTGKPKGAKRIVQEIGCKMIECRPLQINRLEKFMYLENEIPGTQVRAVLTSQENVGAADVSLVTEIFH